MAALAKKGGAGIDDNDILPEGTAPGRLDEDNAARLAAGVGASKVAVRAAGPAEAGAAADA